MKTNAIIHLKQTYMTMLNAHPYPINNKSFYICWWSNVDWSKLEWMDQEYK